MQELEKIHYELEKRIFTAEVYNDDFDGTTITNLICLGDVRDILEKHMNYGWISVEERLPEEKVNSVSQDFYEYQVTAKFGNVKDVRHYKYGNGHWWHGPGIVDKYVIAWRENPEPYRQEQPDTCKYTGGSCCWPIDQCSDCPNNPERSENDQ